MASHRFHSEQEYKELISEHQSVQRKFDSKVEALLKVSQELATCQTERQMYKNQAVDMAERCKAMKLALLAQKRERNRKESFVEEQQQNLAHVFKCVKEENKSLNEEIERLKLQLEEAACDIKLMKAELNRQRLEKFVAENDEAGQGCSLENGDPRPSNGGRCRTNEVLKELERIKSENFQLERDLKSLLCEKEELIVERDAYKTKTDRLNVELNFILNGDERRPLDLDALLAENRFLKEMLQSSREENGLANAALSKYKGVLERAKKSTCRTKEVQPPSGVPFITHKQASAFLGQSQPSENISIDYRALASSLYEAINDKNLALSHQRKANKILGLRIAELETRVQNLDMHNLRSPVKGAKISLDSSAQVDPILEEDHRAEKE